MQVHHKSHSDPTSSYSIYLFTLRAKGEEGRQRQTEGAGVEKGNQRSRKEKSSRVKQLKGIRYESDNERCYRSF